MIEKYRELQKDLYDVFINLEKAYHRKQYGKLCIRNFETM